MFDLKNGYIYQEINANNSTGEILIGNEHKTEEILDEDGNITETINYKFNLETGKYEASE